MRVFAELDRSPAWPTGYFRDDGPPQPASRLPVDSIPGMTAAREIDGLSAP